MNYKKPSGKRELLPAHEVIVEPEVTGAAERSSDETSSAVVDTVDAVDTVEVPTVMGYEKTDGERDPKLYVLFVEGSDKEPHYFGLMQGRSSFSGLKITYTDLASNGDYEGHLARKMCAVVSESYEKGGVTIHKETYSIQEVDDVFIVMDVDSLHDEIAGGINSEKRATWIVSNPCFEICLYYAFHQTPEVDFQYENIEVSKRSSKMKTDLNTIHPGGIGCRDAFFRMADAIKNAEGHYLLDDQGVPCLYATGMHLLATRIYNIIGAEFDKRISERQKTIDKFRKVNQLFKVN